MRCEYFDKEFTFCSGKCGVCPIPVLNKEKAEREKMHCKNCKFAEAQSRVGNGVSEPPYITGFFCKGFSIFPMDEDDFCSYFEEKMEEKDGVN